MLRLGRRRSVHRAEDAPLYVIGNFRAGGGLARSAELYARELRGQGRPCRCVDVSQEMFQYPARGDAHNDASLCGLSDLRRDAGPGTLVIHLNPPQFVWLLCRLGQTLLRCKHIVAYWVWEFEDIPALWRFALRFADAVETPGAFTRAAIARHTNTPVRVRPYAVPMPGVVKQSFLQGGKLRCLFLFDMASRISRKNPQAAIAAFTRAFTPEEAELTLHVIRAGIHPAAWRELEELTAPHPHVRLSAEWLDEAALDRLFLDHDVYLSLHRSEGYGLTIREAMLRGLYVVATGWSGNMDFMQGERVFAVPYRLVPVNGANGAFREVPKARWAEADVGTAAEMLRDIRRKLSARQVAGAACA